MEAQDADRESLLNLYRRLIHLRDANPALATGELIPLNAGNDAIAAYLRREGDRAVLIISNLGPTTLADIRVSSADSVLSAGRYRPTALLGDRSSGTLRVGSDGHIREFRVLSRITSRSSHVFELRFDGR